MEKWIEIARTGTFADSAGREQTFTARDLEAIANAYDPQKRDCPLVFGHPQSDSAPAFGWAQKLKAEGGKLLAVFDKVPEQVRALVDAGHYRHVSMSLMPDRKTLRHVALLGAAQPAIDGLRAVELADGANSITVEFSTKEEGTMPDDAQREIGALKERLAALEKENADLKKQVQGHKEGKDKAEAAKTEAEAKAEKASADFAAYRGKVEGERREARVAELVKAGKVKPAEKTGVLDFAAKLAMQTETVNFAAPDGRTESLSLEERYFRELEARPEDPRFADFSAPPGHAGPEGQAFTFEDMAKKL